MKPLSKKVFLAALLTGLALTAHGQGVARISPMPMRPAPVPMHQGAPAHGTSQKVAGSNHFVPIHGKTSTVPVNQNNSNFLPPGPPVPFPYPWYFNGTGLSVDQLLGNNVPGLGFDYSHLAAVNGNLGVKALIDPATQADVALALNVLRATPPGTVGYGYGGYGGGTYYVPSAEDYAAAGLPVPEEGDQPVESQPTAQQPQQPTVIVVQSPNAQAAAMKAGAAEAAASAPSAPAVPDKGEFILVKKDGTEINAGAFFHQDNQIVYVTPSGMRRSFPFSDLDQDATVLANQERGTDLHTPF